MPVNRGCDTQHYRLIHLTSHRWWLTQQPLLPTGETLALIHGSLLALYSSTFSSLHRSQALQSFLPPLGASELAHPDSFTCLSSRARALTHSEATICVPSSRLVSSQECVSEKYHIVFLSASISICCDKIAVKDVTCSTLFQKHRGANYSSCQQSPAASHSLDGHWEHRLLALWCLVFNKLDLSCV